MPAGKVAAKEERTLLGGRMGTSVPGRGAESAGADGLAGREGSQTAERVAQGVQGAERAG